MQLTKTLAIILADYRLQNNENGVNVINAIYSFYGNENVSAAIITGDTPDQIKEAQQSGFKIKNKPVSCGN